MRKKEGVAVVILVALMLMLAPCAGFASPDGKDGRHCKGYEKGCEYKTDCAKAPNGKHHKDGFKNRQMAEFKRINSNHDGMISPDEWMAGKPQQRHNKESRGEKKK